MELKFETVQIREIKFETVQLRIIGGIKALGICSEFASFLIEFHGFHSEERDKIGITPSRMDGLRVRANPDQDDILVSKNDDAGLGSESVRAKIKS